MQTTPSPVKYHSTTTNRETIETDLSNLRTRNHGFVRKESLRLTPPLDDTKDDARYSHKRRWRRRRRGECDNGGNNLIEKFEAVIKTRVLELRLIGRRSWWPKSVWSKSKHINTSRHAIKMHQTSTSDNVNSNKEIVTKHQSMGIDGAQYTTKELIKKFDTCDSNSVLVVVQKQSKKKIKWKFWIQKEKRTMKPDEDDETTIVDDTRDDMDQIIDDTTTRDGPSKEGEEENLESIISRLEKELRQMRVGKDKGKKIKKRIAEILAGATVSTVGIVVAITLL